MKKKTDSFKNFFIPSILKFKIPFSKENLKMNGEYPRRVEQYEILCQYNDFCIRAPLSGIANVDDTLSFPSFTLKISGKNQILNLYSKDKKKTNFLNIKSVEEFKKFLDTFSLYSFEFKNLLSNLFFDKKKIIFSLYDSYIPSFWNSIFSIYIDELKIFSDWFSKTFDGFYIEYFPNLSKFSQSYKKNLYEFHYKYLFHKQKSEKYYVFSPSTLLALLRALYFEEPFTKNIMILRNYSSNEDNIFLFYNGTPFSEIISQFQFLHNFSFEKKIEINEANYDIFNDYYYYYKDENNKFNYCSGCFICNNFCPVNANPMALVENKNFFKKELCILCGLCEELCESNLPLLEKIRYEVFL